MWVGCWPGFLKGDSKLWECGVRAGRRARRKQSKFLCRPLPCHGSEGHSKVASDCPWLLVLGVVESWVSECWRLTFEEGRERPQVYTKGC